MIACPNCAKENQDHYKFCLACGTKLPGAAAGPEPVGVAAAGPPSPGPAAPPPPMTGGGPGPAPSPEPTPPPAAEPAAPAAAAPVAPGHTACPSCGFDNPPGFKFCGRCGTTLPVAGAAPPSGPDMGNANTIFVDDASEVVAHAQAAQLAAAEAAELAATPISGMDPIQPPEPTDIQTREGMVAAPGGAPAASSGTAPSGFDNQADPDQKTAPNPVVPSDGLGPSAKLVMLGPDGQPIGERVLAPGEVLHVGRSAGPPWDDDAYLDPEHARLSVSDEGIQIEDLESLNGVFLKLSDRVEIHDGDQFRVGQELLLYEDLPEPTPTDDGTEQMGSPNPGYWGRVSVLVDPDSPSVAFPIEGDGLTVGRENGDITFPQDGYVSGTHCRVIGDDSGVYMEDAGSSNGTYMRVRQGQVVPFSSLILIGQKLFQIDRTD